MTPYRVHFIYDYSTIEFWQVIRCRASNPTEAIIVATCEWRLSRKKVYSQLKSGTIKNVYVEDAYGKFFDVREVTDRLIRRE